MKEEFNWIFKMAFIFIALTIIAIGCNNEPKKSSESCYRYAHGDVIPDSLRDDMARFVTETMRACDQHLTTSDYEDVDDVVEEVTRTANKIYSIPVEGLEYNSPDDAGEWWIFIPYYQLSNKQKKIFDSLKTNQQ